jgi:sec-independent protein translocase protein TatC
MSGLYPPESQKLDVVSHLEELRKRLLICLGFIGTATVLLFIRAHDLIRLAKRPLGDLVSNLIFISPTEAFLSTVKVCLLTGFVICFPVILYQAWSFLADAVPKSLRKNIVIWMFLALLLFITGVLFSYFIALPAALDFLLSFGREIATPAITLGKYISFFGALIFVGGVVFEIPIVIGLLSDLGLLKSELLRKKRHYAILAILVVAAFITPTQDIVNLLLFAVPMILLFEVGIWISALLENQRRKRKKAAEHP